MDREPNTIYVASISHGKDSNAMLHVIKDILHYPLDRIITTDVWFDDETRAELPPMVEWKDEADRIILDKWGIPVEHLCAMKRGQRNTYTRTFRHRVDKSKYGVGHIKGFPNTRFSWCKKLKTEEVDIQGYILQTGFRRERERERAKRGLAFASGHRNIRISNHSRELVYERPQAIGNTGFPREWSRLCTVELKNFKKFSDKPQERGAKINIVQYIGIAYDEPKRIEKHKDKKGIMMPLVDAEWTEAMCYEWSKENNLLAPTYTTSMRDGCWFCHNQGVNQLRNLYHNYPDLWAKLLELDTDSPVTFHADGHTVHDFDARFKWEDDKYKSEGKRFKWSDLEYKQMNIEQFI